ncbi:LysR substrate-binding domain protein [Bacteriovorax sp. BSW11_IV]|uniref:LysR family transcriptional regulator n=1 Tax=Bacteriovorax sp. BSW11_IV TaxID=1353529 RepID=UPI00038A4E0D|nr:LysR family transcriptional regulator [Bacteriovorax sp. BSW11_IV]EQC46432.1 LysR substrate-binding domain protein [Bacteriovorax sp. BSW11_IV]
MNNDLNWEDLKFFLALAKYGKLQQAAKALQSNHTTVYRRIKSFEEKSNKKFFNSTPGGYILTTIGEKFLQEILDLEERMDGINRYLDGIDDSLHGNITLTTTSSMAMSVIPKILANLKSAAPDLMIDLKVSAGFFNLTKREADIAIRPCLTPPEHLIGKNLGKVQFALFASEDYLKHSPASTKILDNLARHQLLCLDHNFSHLLSKQWFDKLIVEQKNIYYVDDLTVMARLCAEGLGLAVLPTYFTSVYPNLKQVLRPKEFIGSHLWLLTHKDISKTQKIKFCMDFLARELKKNMKLIN